MSYPKAQLILSYEEFFGVKPIDDRIALIKSIPKRNLLTEILALNYRLKPAKEMNVDSSMETQIRELEYFTAISYKHKKYYKSLYLRHVINKPSRIREIYPLLFTREGCLYALEEVLNSKEFVEADEDFIMADVDVWLGILKYLISINDEITKYKNTDEQEDLLESINSKLISLNESAVEVSAVYTPYRGMKLVEFILQQQHYGTELNDYINYNYSMSPEEFIFKLVHIYIVTQGSEFEFFYYVLEAENSLFNKLSVRHPNVEIYKLISIRKSPFIKFSEEMFLISDVSFLLEKAYSQLINDFWFDWIKAVKDENKNARYPISNYKSMIGYFFESYVATIFRESFRNYKYSKLLLFDDLKIKVTTNQIEIADIYLRYGNRILLGQVKSSSIYDDQKFGGDLTSLYRGSRENFYDNFGVNQLIESIECIENLMGRLDTGFPKGHSYILYPVIVVSDKALQTVLMADIFNKRFQELLQSVNVRKVRVRPLTLIHINEMERMERHLLNKPSDIWNILELNFRDRRFIPSLYNTLNLFGITYEFPDRIRTSFLDVVKKYTG
jgi:hypothetical protein